MKDGTMDVHGLEKKKLLKTLEDGAVASFLDTKRSVCAFWAEFCNPLVNVIIKIVRVSVCKCNLSTSWISYDVRH